MARLLLVVNNTWPLLEHFRWAHRIADRPHVVLEPGIIVEPGERFRPGDPLLLKRPDGSTISGEIGGFVGPVCYPIHDDNLVAIPYLNRDDVPVGTQVWSVDRPSLRRKKRVAT